MKYIHSFVSENEYEIWQVYDSGFQRKVPESRPDYQVWLSEGNIPEEIPYIVPPPPPLPSLEDYKKAKIEAIGNECIARVMGVAGTQEIIPLLLDLIYYTSKGVKYINKKLLKGLDLTSEETEQFLFLEDKEKECNKLREHSDMLKLQVIAADSYEAVDAITWE